VGRPSPALLLATGASIRVTQEFMRHAAPVMTLGTYSHPDAVVRAVSRFALAAVGNQKALAIEHRIDCVASDVYRDREFDAEMSARIISVREKLWDLTQSRKIHLDAFELSALALALRLFGAQRLVDTTESGSAEIELLQFKIETYRKRARRSATARIGALDYQSTAGRWRFVAWLRYNVLYVNLPKRGEPRAATLWREQRRQLTELINKSLTERFFESPNDVEIVKIVTLATRSLRRRSTSSGFEGASADTTGAYRFPSWLC
jgi:hypothetical protein